MQGWLTVFYDRAFDSPSNSKNWLKFSFLHINKGKSVDLGIRKRFVINQYTDKAKLEWAMKSSQLPSTILLLRFKKVAVLNMLTHFP